MADQEEEPAVVNLDDSSDESFDVMIEEEEEVKEEIENLAKCRCLKIVKMPSTDHLVFLQSVQTEFQLPADLEPPQKIYIHKETTSKSYDFYEHKERKSTSPWKGMHLYFPGKLIMKVTPPARNTCTVFWLLERCFLSTKGFDAAGITITYKLNETRQMRIEFFLDNSQVFEKLEDAQPKLAEIFRTKRQFTMRIATQGIRLANDMDFMPIDDGQRGGGGGAATSQSEFDNFYRLHQLYVKKHAVNVPLFSLRSEDLNCQLMPFQKETVRWMIHRETDEGSLDRTPACAQPETLARSYYNYYPHLGVVARTDSEWDRGNAFMSKFSFRGGILADEMGLGKTVQVLALVSAHRRDEVLIAKREKSPERVATNRQTVANEGVAEQVRIAEKSYEELSHAKSSKVKVWFSAAAGDEGAIQCTTCSILCDAKICGWKYEEPEVGGLKFVCPSCMCKCERKEIGTTLIILPESLIFQWFTEVAKHCSDNIRVMFYFGVRKHGYLQPHDMNNYDVILTTYDTLRAEVVFSEEKGPRRKLRNEFTPHYITSPLTHVKFWRVIVDEAQVLPVGIKGSLNKMLLKLSADNWWCVTGTPLVKSINDLVTTFTFLDLYPFCFQDFFNHYAIQQLKYAIDRNKRRPANEILPNLILDVLGKIMTRKTKEEVIDQLGLPKLIEIEKKICFTAIEERQYKEEKERMKKIVARTLGKSPSNAYLSELSCRDKVLQDLRVLREMILTGQTRGRSSYEAGGTNYVYAPETVIFRLIHLKKVQIKNHFRSYMSSQMGVAGANLLLKMCLAAKQAYQDALAAYKEMTDAEENIVSTLGLERFRAVTGINADQEALDELEVHIRDDSRDVETVQKTASNQLRAFRQTRRKYEFERRPEEQKEEEETTPEPPVAKKPRVEEGLDVEIAEDAREQQEEEKERQAYSQKLAAIALRPMRMDCTQEVHLVLNLRGVQMRLNDDETPVPATQLHEVFLKFYDNELKCVKELPTEVNAWTNVFSDPFMQNLFRYFNLWKKSLIRRPQDPHHLYQGGIHLVPDVKKDLCPFLPFNPFYDDGGTTRDIRHSVRNCMGGCSPLHEIEQFVGLNSCLPLPDIIWKTYEQMKSVDDRRRQIQEDMLALIERLVETSKPDKISAYLTRNETDVLSEEDQKTWAMLGCEHSILVGTKEEKERVLLDSFDENPCQLCEVHTSLVRFQFDAGFSSFHGVLRLKSGLLEFVSYLFDCYSHDAGCEATKFLRYAIRPFFERCQDFVKGYSSALLVCLELLNRFDELEQSKTLITEEQVTDQMRRLFVEEDVKKLPQMYINQFTHEAKAEMTSARKHIHEMRYLTNLLKTQLDGKNSDEPCPICRTELRSFMVFTCGHRICHECFELLKDATRREAGLSHDSDLVKCPTCRTMDKVKRVMIVKSGHAEEDSVIPGIMLSAKMSSAILLIREIIEADHKNKIILFTNIEPSSYAVWRYLQKILKLANIPYSVMVRSAYGKKVVDFQVSDDIKVLLCSISLCANGLNMTGANHIIFLDPPHHRSVLLQAIGRINRFGQKREMKVHHLVVAGSLDVELRESAKKKEQDPNKQRLGWTCGDIRAMFDIPSPRPQIEQQANRFAAIMNRMIRIDRQVDHALMLDVDDDDLDNHLQRALQRQLDPDQERVAAAIIAQEDFPMPPRPVEEEQMEQELDRRIEEIIADLHRDA